MSAARGTQTPWGPLQSAQDFGKDGIFFASTASHGGFYVPLALLERVSAEGRTFAKRWSGSEQWYEEDCAACYVVASFPELFPPEQVAEAKEGIEVWGGDRPYSNGVL